MGLFYMDRHEKEFQRLASRAVTTRSRVLDVGTGAEHSADAPADYGIGVGDEFSTVTLDRRTDLQPTTVGDLSSLPFADGSFGIVFVESVLEHVWPFGKIHDSLAEIHRVLVEGGVVAGYVPYCFHFHGRSFPDPVRLTYDGIDRLLSPFADRTIEASGGPISIFLDSLPRGGYRVRQLVEPVETTLRYTLYDGLLSMVDVSLRLPETTADSRANHLYAINSTGFRFFAQK